MDRDNFIKVFAEFYKETFGVSGNDDSNALSMMCAISEGLSALHNFGYASEDILRPVRIISEQFEGHPQKKNIDQFLWSVLSITIVANRYLWDNEKIASKFRSLIDQE